MEEVRNLLRQAVTEVDGAHEAAELEQVRVRYLGKKGLLTLQLKQLGTLPPAERPVAGQVINEAKQELASALKVRGASLEREQLERRLEAESLDVTQPERGQVPGSFHPVTRAMTRIIRLFREAGFEVREGPEIEDDFHNFEALNIPAHHPARAMHDTFYLESGKLLRTHTLSGPGAGDAGWPGTAQDDRTGAGLPLRFRPDSYADVSPGRGSCR